MSLIKPVAGGFHVEQKPVHEILEKRPQQNSEYGQS